MRLLALLCLAIQAAAQNAPLTPPVGHIEEAVLRRGTDGRYPMDGYPNAVYRNGLRQARGVDYRLDGFVVVPLTTWQPDDLVLVEVLIAPDTTSSEKKSGQQNSQRPPNISSSTNKTNGVGPKGPGLATGANMRECQAGDTSPNGTVVAGYRKIITATPFGLQCRWELVR